MKQYRSLAFRLYVIRANYRRWRRLCFSSPAEIEFLRIMGGKYITFNLIKDPKTNFPFTLVISRGKILKRERLVRELRVGAMFLDFGTVGLSYQKGLEIDGLAYHGDIIKEQKRDEYLKQYGWEVLHIKAADVFYNRNVVRARVANFLAS